MNEEPRRLRLLVLASTYPRYAGDPEPSFVHELSRRLVSRFEVTVLCPHAPGARAREVLDAVQVVRYRYAPARLERLVNDGGIVTNLRRHPWMLLLVPGFVLAQAAWLWRLGHYRCCDVIHAHWLLPQGLLVAGLQALGRPLAPFLVTSHGADLFALRGGVFAVLKRFVLRRAGAVTVVSTAMRDAIAELGVHAAAVRVEPMGVDLAGRFRPDPAEARSPDTLLFVGRLVEKKGLRHLIDAMPAVRAAHPAARLEVAGFGPEREALEARAAALGLGDAVRFLDAVPQDALPALYRRAAVFVAPFVEAASGDQEGLGLVVVEALGCGARAVVSDLPATRELGNDLPGLVRVPPGDPAALAAGLVALLAAPAVAAGARAPGLIRFDWAARAASYADRLGALVPATAAGARGPVDA